MAYLTEKEVRARAAGFDFGFGDFSVGLMLLNISQIFRSSFDIFLRREAPAIWPHFR